MNELDIKKLRAKMGISQEKLAESIGVSLRTIQNWESGSVIPKSKHAILHMIINDGSININSSETDSNNNSIDSNLYPAKPFIDSCYAECGKAGGFSLAVKKEDCENISIPFMHDYDFSITATGDSMINRVDTSKSIRGGDIVACKIAKSRTHVRFGEIYALSTLDGFMIKKVVESGKENFIRCESFNIEDGYAPFDIPTDEIFDWAFVVGVARISKW